jgi:serine/threonine protein kinase
LVGSKVALPKRVGEYEIVRELRAGGMGTLVLGRRQGPAGFARHVAIKLLHPHLAAEPDYVQMFLEEARLASRFRHPNVVAVEELGEENGAYYLVMEYVNGCSLSELLQRLGNAGRGLAPPTAVWIAAQLADGLHAAHETLDLEGRPLGLVHRDISPQNVMLTFDGHVKLIDFGVAKATSMSTTTGVLRGKVAYMSPEQAYGERLDRRADVYALGVVLWEMFTGRRRFRGENEMATLQLVQNPTAVPPSRYAIGVTAALDELVLRACEPDAVNRFQTAREMRRALVTACPEAVQLGNEDLAALLASTMRDVKRMRTTHLSFEFPGGAPAEAQNDRARTMTHQIVGEPAAALIAGDDAKPARREEIETVKRRLPKISDASEDDVETRAPRREPVSERPIAAARPAKMSLLWPAVALVTMGLAVGSGLALFFLWPDPRPPAEPRVASRPIEPAPIEEPQIAQPAIVLPEIAAPEVAEPAPIEPAPEVELGVGRHELTVGARYRLDGALLMLDRCFEDGSVLIELDDAPRLIAANGSESFGRYRVRASRLGADRASIEIAVARSTPRVAPRAEVRSPPPVPFGGPSSVRPSPTRLPFPENGPR